MKISIIGAGNMAHQLGQVLVNANHDIVEIYNRNVRKGASLAKKLLAGSVKKISQLNMDIDLIIIAVSDDAIGEVSSQLNIADWSQVTIVHTSGSVSLTVLDQHKRYGVFYPFQSMTAGQDVDFNPIPILVDANSERAKELLCVLATSISESVHKVSDGERGVVHVAGVFANNFSNHMVALAKGILEQNSLSFDIVKPLIVNTLQKILEINPVDAQTGPAIRRDEKIISKHLEFLDNQPHLKDLYQSVTESIISLDESKNG